MISGSKQSSKASSSAPNSGSKGGGKSSNLFEKFKKIKIVDKIGKFMQKLQLKAPIHLMDSMITYAIGVVSGMQDMAQVLGNPPFLFGTASHQR
jgi:hypothetical protein